MCECWQKFNWLFANLNATLCCLFLSLCFFALSLFYYISTIPSFNINFILFHAFEYIVSLIIIRFDCTYSLGFVSFDTKSLWHFAFDIWYTYTFIYLIGFSCSCFFLVLFSLFFFFFLWQLKIGESINHFVLGVRRRHVSVLYDPLSMQIEREIHIEIDVFLLTFQSNTLSKNEENKQKKNNRTKPAGSLNLKPRKPRNVIGLK